MQATPLTSWRYPLSRRADFPAPNHYRQITSTQNRWSAHVQWIFTEHHKNHQGLIQTSYIFDGPSKEYMLKKCPVISCSYSSRPQQQRNKPVLLQNVPSLWCSSEKQLSSQVTIQQSRGEKTDHFGEEGTLNLEVKAPPENAPNESIKAYNSMRAKCSFGLGPLQEWSIAYL